MNLTSPALRGGPSPVAQRLEAPIRRGCSTAGDPKLASAEIAAQLAGSDPAAVILFCSSHYDLRALAEGLAGAFGDIPILGCTSSGEVTPFGYRDGAITGVALPAADFGVAVRRIDGVAGFDIGQAHLVVQSLLREADANAVRLGGGEHAALLLVDGLCVREEMLALALHTALGRVPMIGGSTGDDLAFKETFVLHEGAFHRDAALLIALTTPRKLKAFSHQHFEPSSRRMVVTAANPAERRVVSINAEPAAREYARMIGQPEAPLNPMTFAANPVMVRAGGDYYVRAIQKANPDDSLTFFCAIDEGIVLTLADAVDIRRDLEAFFADLCAELGPVELVLGFDCVHRSLELEQKQLKQSVGEVLAANRVVGFCTYGEQFNAMHVNQTFTGLAIGSR